MQHHHHYSSLAHKVQYYTVILPDVSKLKWWRFFGVEFRNNIFLVIDLPPSLNQNFFLIFVEISLLFSLAIAVHIHSRIRQITVISNEMEGAKRIFMADISLFRSETFFMCNFKICYQNFPLTFCCFICQCAVASKREMLPRWELLVIKKSTSIWNWIFFSELRNSFHGKFIALLYITEYQWFQEL